MWSQGDAGPGTRRLRRPGSGCGACADRGPGCRRLHRPRPRLRLRQSAAGVGASAEGAASKGLTCLADAYNGKMKGTKVSMTGPFADADEVKFQEAKKAFEEATGITIQYQGTKEFEASIGTQMAAGTAPDIIDFPQPGLLGTFFKQGKVVPVTKLVPESWLKENYKQSWLDMATMPGADGNPDDGRPLVALQRQEPGVVPQEGLRRGRVQGSDYLG